MRAVLSLYTLTHTPISFLDIVFLSEKGLGVNRFLPLPCTEEGKDVM